MSLGKEFKRWFDIDGAQWIDEGEALGAKLAAAGVPIARGFDHGLLVGDSFLAMAGPLEELGYAVGIDETLYLGRVEGFRYVGIAATLGAEAPARALGWFDHVLISQPAHQPAYEQIQKNYKGGPVLHHVALSVSYPAQAGESDEDYALRAIPQFLQVRSRVGELTGEALQRVTMSIPQAVLDSVRFQEAFAGWTKGQDPAGFALEAMMGGGFFLQFASTSSYRVEVVLRQGTKLGFNPVAQTKLSHDVVYA